jgi:hypothetical protein
MLSLVLGFAESLSTSRPQRHDAINRWLADCRWFNIISAEMSHENIQLRFDGPELRGHEMDVSLLGPSLVGLGNLCTEANRILNRDDAKVRVLIKADVKANCVTLDLSVVQNLISQAHALISNTNIVTAKEILEWIGILSGGCAGVLKLIPYLKWRKNNKDVPLTVTQKDSSGNILIIQVQGSNNTIEVPKPVYDMAQSPKMVESVRQLASPVSEETGIDEAVFIHEKKEHLKIDKPLAKELSEISVDPENSEAQFFKAHIVVHKPTLDTTSKHWAFKMNGRIENIDISATKIASDVITRGKVCVGDTYYAKIQFIERRTKQGTFVTDYKIVEVLEFKPGERHVQDEMFPRKHES